MEKLFVYNFNGTIYETNEAFDTTYRQMKAECLANNEPFTRQTIIGDEIIDEVYRNGCWIRECDKWW